MDCVRLGVIGVGGMGTAHVQSLLKGDVKRVKLTAVCDIEPGKLEPYHDLKTFTDSRELIRSGLVDAVLIATPHYDHTTIGIDAFEQGLHVLTEKPISVHKADAERLIAAYKKAKDRVFGVMFQLRTLASYKRIKALLESGELGEIRRILWSITDWYRTEAYYASGGWRATWKGEGGGVLMNQCPHNLDLFQWFFGMPSRVHAFCGFGKYHDIEVEDDVTAFFEYDSGATALFLTSTGEAPGSSRLEVAGDRGLLTFQYGKLTFTRNEIDTKTFTKTAKGGFERPGVWNIDIPFRDTPDGHYIVTQKFVDAILDGTPPLVCAEEGIRSLELANAMIYSAWTNAPVALPLDGKAYETALKKHIADSKFQKKTSVDAEMDYSKSFHS